MRNIIYCFILFFILTDFTSRGNQKFQRPNILFIVSDDLNDWVGCFGGHPQVKTPNIDKLARRGVIFENAYCAAPLCGPSRSAFMTGMQPYSTGLYNNGNSNIQKRKDLITMPQYFREEGYFVAGAGKLFHNYKGEYAQSLFDEYAKRRPFVGGGPFVNPELNSELQNPVHIVDREDGKLKAVLPLNGMPNDRSYNKRNTFDWGPVDVTDDEMEDGNIASYIINKLKQKYDKPFFLGAGFIRPHQPLFAPRKYHKLYPVESVILPKITENDLDDVSQTAKDFGRLAATSGTHKTVMKYGQWKNAVSSYMACVSFVDAQIGKILNALDQSDYANNTIIVFLGDNGWHLGEKEHWGKWTGWELAFRVPLIIVPPKAWETTTGKRVENSVVSLIDIFPTLIEMTKGRKKLNLDGRNVAPLFERDEISYFQDPVVTTFGYGNNTVITDKWHYIHYFDGTEELYNLDNDEEEWENLIRNSKLSGVIENLKQNLPDYPEVEHFVRWGNWKVVLTKDKLKTELYDLYEPGGMTEKNNLAFKNKEIIDSVRNYIAENRLDDKFIFVE